MIGRRFDLRMKNGDGVLQRLASLARDRRGIGAVEFALLAPLLLMLYIGAFEITVGLSVSKRATRAAGAVADLVTQQDKPVDKTFLTTMSDVADAIFVPYSTSNLTLKITGVTLDANAKAAFFFIQQAGRTLADGGSIVTLVSSLLAAYTPFYAIYPGSKAAVEHFTRAASKEFGERGISVNAIGPGPMDTPFFYGQESKEAVAYHSSAAALSKFSKKGLTDIEDIAPIVRFLVTEGWWITGQTIFANGGYTTR